MTQYKNLNVKFSNPQFNKLKSRIKNGNEVSINLPSNVIGNCNDETNSPHKLLLINIQLLRLRKVNNALADINSRCMVHKTYIFINNSFLSYKSQKKN